MSSTECCSKDCNSEDLSQRQILRNSDGKTKQRNRRMLVNIQSALGVPNGALKSRNAKPAVKSDTHTFNSLAEVLDRLRMADLDVDVSLADIRPFILTNGKSFDREQLRLLSASFCGSAMMQINLYYVVGLCVDLCYNREFLEEMAFQLKLMVETFVNADEETDDERIRNLPDFMAQLAVIKWPRGKDKAFENCNPILYSVVNTITGWIDMIVSFSAKDDSPNEDELSLLVRCCEGIYTFCTVGQRSIWLNFPDIFDRVYEATSSLLTSNLILAKSLKSSFLQLYGLLGKWSLNNTKKHTSIATQTIYRP